MKLEDIRKMTHELEIPRGVEGQQRVHEHLRQNGLEPGRFYQELEMNSRYVDTHQDSSFSNSVVFLHSHSYYEILLCRTTCDVEYLVGPERYRLQKGDIVIVPPGISHKPLLPHSMTQPYIRDVIWVSTEMAETMIHLCGQELFALSKPRLLRTADTRWEFLGELFRAGVRESERREPGWEAAVIGNSIQLLTHLCRAILDRSSKALRAEKPELLDEVLAYVETHLAEKLTLSEVAKHFWVSQSTITQTFRNKMGVSFYRCVTQRRLIAAKLLIAEGCSMEDVGRRVGFTDYSTFYRAFKQEFGISPRQYRKKQDLSEPADT